MAAGKISIQANDGKVAGVVFEDGASSNVTVTVPKEGGVLATQSGLDTAMSTINASVPAAYHIYNGQLALANTVTTTGFSTTLYTGNGATQSITTGVDMDTQWGNDASEKFGGLVWLKSRSATTNNFLFDTLRGTNNEINSNTTEANATLANSLTSFNSDGFSLGGAAGVRWLTSVIVYPKLWNLHLANAKKGLYNWYVRIVNAEFKGWSLARLFRIDVQSKSIETFVIDKAALYSNVFLVVRGFVWWLLPMIGVGLWTGSAMVAVVGLFVLSFGWIICADLGYYFRDKIAIEKYGLSYIGGWELQEGFYGLMQDLVLIGGICYVMV